MDSNGLRALFYPCNFIMILIIVMSWYDFGEGKESCSKLWSQWMSEFLVNDPDIFPQPEAAQAFHCFILQEHHYGTLSLRPQLATKEESLAAGVAHGRGGGEVVFCWYWPRLEFDSFNMYDGLHSVLRMVCFKTETWSSVNSWIQLRNVGVGNFNMVILWISINGCLTQFKE